MLGIFYKDKDSYTNKLNIINGYHKQLSFYISKIKDISLEEASNKANEIIKSRFKDKTIVYFEREENGDRVVKNSSLLNYITTNLNNNILAPTFTSYQRKSVNPSILAEFIAENVKKRSIAKKIAQKAKSEGNTELMISKDNEQNMMKIYNNSLSGAFAQEACILYNPTAHSTLTSITRSITSLSNASNEKLVAGNRYYPRGIDVLNNIVYIAANANKTIIQQVIDRYNLHYPSVEDTVSVLKYSSDLYFIDNAYYNKFIIPFLNKLDKVELAAICYIGDLYHIRKFNDKFVRDLIDILTLKIEKEDNDVSIPEKIHGINENVLNFVHQIFFSKIKGYGKDYVKMHKDNIASSLYYTSSHIIDVLNKYKDFFNAFFMQDIFPGNSFRLKYMRRRTVVLSDTDSTCFTLDEWVKWYKGDFIIEDKTIAIAGAISFIASQAIIHQLALLSKYMNIDKENLNTLAMKNEFLWLVHIPCEVSKHYFAYTVMQEGNVFSKPDIEIKGVHLKSSAVPKFVIEDSKELMRYILSTISNNNKVKLTYPIDKVKLLEKNITDSIIKGEPIYLKKSKIKNKEAYALEEDKSPFQRHTFWVDVFAPKYGNIQNPPYDVIKLPTIIDSKLKLVEWVNSITDLELKNRLWNWLEKYNKKDLSTIYLNEQYVLGNGIPEEISKVINIKRIILDVTIQHRIILETMGLIIDENKLISEQF